MITGPEEGAAAGHGRSRASHADREHVIDTLKTAFADGRLDKDELDDRVGQALAARTYAELAMVTADIPVTLASQRADRSRASRGQLPPRPGQPDRLAESGRHGSTGHKPSPRRTRTGQTRASLPVRKSRQDRPHHSGQAVPVSRGARLAPGGA